MSISVVIRETGERTADACRYIVQNQVDRTSIRTVSAYPFEKCLRNCYEAGIEMNEKWTVTLDGDVLLRNEAISILVEEAESMGSSFAQAQARIFDKLSGSFRYAGNRIYRTELLPKAIMAIPEEGEFVRPETETLQRLCLQGHPLRESSAVVGIHDFEQSNSDIYRKACLHSFKHRDILKQMLHHWEEGAETDDDFVIALNAFSEQLLSLERPQLNNEYYGDRAEKLIERLGISEKKPLHEDSLPDDFVDEILNNYSSPEFSTGYDYFRHRDPIPIRREKTLDRLLHIIQKHGIPRSTLVLIGRFLTYFGTALVDFSKRK